MFGTGVFVTSIGFAFGFTHLILFTGTQSLLLASVGRPPTVVLSFRARRAGS